MASLSAGTVVGGKYRLEKPIGQGGMASVWRAVHTTLESPVAVKLLDTYGVDRHKMAKRFLREAKLSAQLRHRNIVHILDFGVLDEGQPFMVMELLTGTSLADLLESQTRPSDLQFVEIVAQTLSGLAAAHDAGVVHRDIKPDNVFIVRDADGDFPKLLDFGISRGADPVGGDTRMTNTGAVVGTPLYMSPEQARGHQDLDRRTDLWSVGVILYEGLARRLPFESEHMGDVLIKIATEAPQSLHELRSDLPPALCDLVMKALSKDRDQRFSDAREMREALLKAAEALGSKDSGSSARRRLPGAGSSFTAEWEESETEVDPAAVVMERVATDSPATVRRRWVRPLAIAGALVALGVGGFVALGGEIRFQSAQAEADRSSEPDGTKSTAVPTDGSSSRDEPAEEERAPPREDRIHEDRIHEDRIPTPRASESLRTTATGAGATEAREQARNAEETSSRATQDSPRAVDIQDPSPDSRSQDRSDSAGRSRLRSRPPSRAPTEATDRRARGGRRRPAEDQARGRTKASGERSGGFLRRLDY